MRAETPPLTHAPHLFVDDVVAPSLRAADRQHLEVLRIRAGDPLVVSDGAGRWRLCENGPSLRPIGQICEALRPAPRLSIAFALTKAGKPEVVVQKLTELGIDRIVIVASERSVVRWNGERADRHLSRLEAIAREAAMQSRRVYLPQIEGIVGFGELARREPVAVAVRGGPPLALRRNLPIIAIGPEGGFTDAERALAAERCGLGPTVLRAETAAIAAAAIVAVARG